MNRFFALVISLCCIALTHASTPLNPPMTFNEAAPPLPTILQQRGGVTAKVGFIKAVPAGSLATAAYLTLYNHGLNSTDIVNVSSPISERAELHTHVFEGDRFSMKKLATLSLPHKATFTMEPGGYHIMLIGLKETITPGDQVELWLEFDDGGKLQLTVPAFSPADIPHRHAKH